MEDAIFGEDTDLFASPYLFKISKSIVDKVIFFNLILLHCKIEVLTYAKNVHL